MVTKPAWIVVTDLDGTLLDHQTYSYQPAQQAMDRLASANIPLVLNTSKTRAELMRLRGRMGNSEPFIVENGSAVFVPEGLFSPPPPATGQVTDADQNERYYCQVFGREYADIVAWLAARRERYAFESFSDYSVQELAGRTGLPGEQAALALAREFSEPLVWQDSEQALGNFQAELAGADLSSLRGGRFLHVLGLCDKGQSLEWLRRCYQHTWQRQVRVVALGDSYNDVAMLQAADIAVVVRSSRHPPPVIVGPGMVIVSDREGPAGWGDAIQGLFDQGSL